ncbi:glycosyltransferase [Candidatus Woesearchaeota archaeon]|nr:glycosyltransferase [Candidatus Woesearchaeota archaeon]
MISIVIPAYNESETIESTIKKIRGVMKNLGEEWELIIVDDCSSDNTLKKIRAFKKKYEFLRIFSHKKNLGPGAGFRTGFKQAEGDIIITNDADSSFSPKDIPRLLSEIKNADVVIGSQHMEGARMINVPIKRVIASKAALFLDRLFLGVRLSSLSSFFVAYRKNVIKTLNFESNGFDAQCEILTKLYHKGYKIKEIPCSLRWDIGRKRKSSINIFKEAKKRVKLWRKLKKA